MKKQNNLHLSEEDLIRAVVDGTDMPISVHDHLSCCPLCSSEKDELERRLELLGQMAEEFAPVPRRKVILYNSFERRRWWNWNWQKGLSVGMAVAAVILVVCGSIIWKTTMETRLARLNQEILQDDRFMSEVTLLSQNALPLFWQDISEEPEPAFDDEFIEFVIPSPEDNLVSGNAGGMQCC